MERFGLRDKFGYFMGDFSNCFFFVLTGTFLTAFYTDVMGLDGKLVGITFFLARLFSAFTDVGMGRVVDGAKPGPRGKFRVWISRLALPMAVSAALLFLPVSGLPAGVKTVYALATYFLYVTMYSAITIPYGSMAAVMTTDPGERTSLSTFRNVGSSISSAMVNFLIPTFCVVSATTGSGAAVERIDGGRFFGMTIFFCVCALVGYTLCAKLCKERVAPKMQAPGEKQSLRSILRAVVRNRPFLVLSGVAIVLLLSQQIVGTINTFVYKDYFKQSGLLSIAGLLMTLCTFALAPFMSKIVDRFGKKEAVSVATLVSGFFYLLLGVLHVSNVWVYLALSLCATFGAAFFNTIVWALVLDVINYQEVLTGDRSEASVYAFYSFSRKIGQALAGGLGGVSLSLVGYVSASAGQVVEQSVQTVNNLYRVATFVPGAAYLIIAALMTFAYPLTKKKVLDMAAKLSGLQVGQG